jgi:hypothetical protein
MKKFILVIVAMLLVGVVQSQPYTKTNLVYHNTYTNCQYCPSLTECAIFEHISLDSNMNYVNRYFLLDVHDWRYKHLENTFTIVKGSAQDVVSFLEEIEKFFIYENGITMDCGSYSLTRYKQFLYNVVVYTMDNGSTHTFTKSYIKTIKRKLTNYCNNNNIDFDT